MKLIIDIPEMAYEAYKEWHKNKVASAEQSLIANGIPYEETPHDNRTERALSIIDRLYTEGHINNMEQGVLRRCILFPEKGGAEE